MPRPGWLSLFAIGGVALGAYLVIALVPTQADGNGVGHGRFDPDDYIRTVPVMAELSADKPLRMAVRGEFEDLKPNSTRKLFFTTPGVYMGPLSVDGIEAVIARGRGHVLEHRLAAQSLERLRATLVEFDQAMRDVSLLIEEERVRVIEQLRRREDRHIVIRTQPVDADPEYMSLKAAQAQVSKGRGSVWGVPEEGGAQTHVIVKWEEWPALKAMMDDRLYMIEDRERRVREWIEAVFRDEGLSAFDRPPDEPGGGRSPAVRRNG